LDESSQHHFHFVKLTNSITLSTRKVAKIFLSVVLLDVTLSNEKPSCYNYTLEKKPKNFFQKDRCVLTATNLSPPLA
jgi:hypothetical protein